MKNLRNLIVIAIVITVLMLTTDLSFVIGSTWKQVDTPTARVVANGLAIFTPTLPLTLMLLLLRLISPNRMSHNF